LIYFRITLQKVYESRENKLESRPNPPTIYVFISLIALIVSITFVVLAGDFNLNWKIFIKSNNYLLPLLGYLLSPFIPIICLAFLRNKDNQFRSNIYYDIGKSRFLIKIASLVAFISFVVGTLHVVRIAYILQGL
jgi:purine-cytosine permease-like protein